jgi:UDP-N-acetyl-D-glucosamine dehydrogenase
MIRYSSLNSGKGKVMSQKKVVIVGQGYVGLPLAAACVAAGWDTVGVEINPTHISSIKTGNHDLLSTEEKFIIENALKNHSYEVTDDFSSIIGGGTIIYCLPTPLARDGNPDLSILQEALKKTGPYINNGSLVVLESTSFPGTTRNYFAHYLKDNFSNCINCDFAFSPERVDPNNKTWDLRNTPKIVAGLTHASKMRAVEFYLSILESVIPVDSLEIAELAKLIENTYRLINISFINELQVAANKLDIPLRKAIEAASTKPYGFQTFYPSAGIGGHCIPVDPVYLNWATAQVGFPLSMVESALAVNKRMHEFVIQRLQDLNVPQFSKVLIAGIGYKPGITDMRESPAIQISALLENLGYEVYWCDLNIKESNLGKRLNSYQKDISSIIILQEIDPEILSLGILSHAVILDCTGKYELNGVIQL